MPIIIESGSAKSSVPGSWTWEASELLRECFMPAPTVRMRKQVPGQGPTGPTFSTQVPAVSKHVASVPDHLAMLSTPHKESERTDGNIRFPLKF